MSDETAPAPLSPDQRALVMAALIKEVRAELELTKAEFSPRYELGTTIRWDSPLGDPLGAVLRTKPRPDWRVTDPDALAEHLAAEYPGVVETVHLLPVPGVGLVELAEDDELYRVVAEHAPHMLVAQQRVTTDAISAAVEQSRATGIPAAPGITLVRPGGELQVRPDKNAGVAIRRMITAGLIDATGRPVLAQTAEVTS